MEQETQQLDANVLISVLQKTVNELIARNIVLTALLEQRNTPPVEKVE